MEDVIVRAASQEHGILACRSGKPVPAGRFRIGQRLRILPNHACATAGKHDGYWLIGDGQQPRRYWPRIHGW
jgi:D-serine deaminase-like pyridoxal phosphate-dependent protein